MSDFIYAIHDYSPIWSAWVRNAGRQAWCVYTEAIGSDPNDQSGRVYPTDVTNIVRLNAGYGSGGTIPLPNRYNDFAKRCANFVANSRNIQYVIIGNEIQMQWDWPDNQPITLDNYMVCYLKTYTQIKIVAPHVKVGPAPVATWNNGLKYPGNERGDWVKLQADIWSLSKPWIDALYIHAYSHGYSPDLVTNTARMDGAFTDRYYHFPVYRQFMEAVPLNLRHLPVFITEMNGDCSGQGACWPNHNMGWIRAAYQEIDRWNKSNSQKILCGALFRWEPGDHRWTIHDKQGVHDDFRQALTNNYQHGFVPGKVTRQVTVLGLNLREVPGGKVITVLPQGTILEVLADGSDWIQVKTNGLIGYVFRLYTG